ncbi:MAG: hypothetical protein IJ050_06890 [Clostridia bacterium]|nr:hypothetical protein [Clostridia bacterium]
MKHGIFSKITAVVIAVMLICLPLFNAFGATDDESAQECPYIFIHGFMGTDLYENPDDPDSDVIWPPSTDSILEAVKVALPALGKLILDKDWDAFSKKVMPYAYAIFEPVMLAPDGTVKDNSGARMVYPEPEDVKSDSHLNFKYDWRIDPIEVAAQLNDFIDFVLENSGSEQVMIECHSFGGIVANTYAKLYGNSKIRSIVYNTTAIYGEGYTGEMLSGHIVLNGESLTEYLKMTMDRNEYRNLINGIFKLLYDAGLTDAVCALGNKIIDNLAADASTQVLAPLFGGWLSIWAMVEDDAVDEAMSYVFDTLYAGSDVDRSGLLEKINDYNTRIRPYKTETLRQMNDSANVYVISRYGYSGLLLVDSWKTITDGTVDSKNSSFGATIAPYGETLTEEYLAKADAKYISPDKTLDASTCMFPEQTWFIRRFEHSDGCRTCDDFIMKLLCYDGQADIGTFEQYPQFMDYDLERDSIMPDKLIDKGDTGFFARLKLIFGDILKLIKNLVLKVFGK